MGDTQAGPAALDPARPTHAGQRPYTPAMLLAYDTLVYRLNAPLLWRCPKSRLLSIYDESVSSRHLDIGVGTGLLIEQCRFPSPCPQITLMDLNPNPLAVASRRLGRYRPRTHQADALLPWGLGEGAFDSVAMANLLHCLPGTMAEKAIVFEHAGKALAPGGVLFGATVLGCGVKHTRLSRRALLTANRKGVFCNLGDDPEGLDAALAGAFTSHEIEIEGAIALFRAHGKSPAAGEAKDRGGQ